MKLEKEQIEHIANLARLDLTDKELDVYGDQLSNTLSYIEQLQEVDIDGVEPTAQVTGMQNVLREDVVESWDDSEVDESIKQAPELEDGQIKVRRVLE